MTTSTSILSIMILCLLPPNSFLSNSSSSIQCNLVQLLQPIIFLHQCHIMTLHEQVLVKIPEKPDGILAQNSGQCNIKVEQSWCGIGQRCNVDQNIFAVVSEHIGSCDWELSMMNTALYFSMYLHFDLHGSSCNLHKDVSWLNSWHPISCFDTYTNA